jgi:polyisoprenoid-binding protein YceI
MKRAAVVALLAIVAGAPFPPGVAGETIVFKLLPDYSRATFKSDAPLETVVGHAAAHGVQGTLSVDPEKPAGARGTIRVDMNSVRTGLDRRDADMRSKDFLETDVDANRWVTFELTGVHIGEPLVAGQAMRAKVRGILTVKQKPLARVADATVTWLRLTPEQLEVQKRFGFAADNIKVRARLFTSFSNHGMRLPQILFFKVADDIEIETDLTFARE